MHRKLFLQPFKGEIRDETLFNPEPRSLAWPYASVGNRPRRRRAADGESPASDDESNDVDDDRPVGIGRLLSVQRAAHRLARDDLGPGRATLAATPPTLEWSRRVRGSTTDVSYQARKPASAARAGKDAIPLEYFTIKDWLVAGPFDTRDGASGIDTDYLGGETKVLPDDGGKAGTAVWKFTHNSMETQTSHVHNEGQCRNLSVDFVFNFGTFSRDAKHTFKVEGDFTNKVAYAHTYIYAPAGGAFQLMNLNWGSAAKAWLNGRPLPVVVETNSNVWNKKEINVTLAKGWNRLLVKVASAADTAKIATDAKISNWRSVTYLLRAAGNSAIKPRTSLG